MFGGVLVDTIERLVVALIRTVGARAVKFLATDNRILVITGLTDGVEVVRDLYRGVPVGRDLEVAAVLAAFIVGCS